jgi:D-beta-D-heptose 7-phosphate kinase/D-beta-D-heptose 1-phosphate adenosyltransferase
MEALAEFPLNHYGFIDKNRVNQLAMKIEYDSARLMEAVDRFSETEVLVVGDVMLDEFIWGRVDRISPEAPVPVVEVTRETSLLGGAANTINNIVSAGGRARLIGVVGQDRQGGQVVRMLEKLGVDASGVVRDPERPTTRKTRVVAHAQQVVRFDRETKKPLSEQIRNKIFAALAEAAGKVKAVIISDYGKGLVSAELIEKVHQVFTGPNRIVAVDPKVQNFHLYRRVTVITPNHHEAAQGSGIAIASEKDLVRAGHKIIQDLDCESVLITRGEQGMTLFEKNRPPAHIPTVAREIYDVTGAGDTVIAIMTLGRAAGLSRLESAILANFAAGIVVGEVGTSAVSAEKLKDIVANGAWRLQCK